MLAVCYMVLLAFCAQHVFAANEDPANHFPTDVVLIYPGSKVALNQHFSIASFPRYARETDLDVAGIQSNMSMGYILPDGSHLSKSNNSACNVGLASTNLSDTEFFSVSGTYTVYWNFTTFLASDPKAQAPATDGHSGTCGAGPYMSQFKNFTATFEVGGLPNGPEGATLTTVTSQFPGPTGTVTPPSSTTTPTQPLGTNTPSPTKSSGSSRSGTANTSIVISVLVSTLIMVKIVGEL